LGFSDCWIASFQDVPAALARYDDFQAALAPLLDLQQASRRVLTAFDNSYRRMDPTNLGPVQPGVGILISSESLPRMADAEASRSEQLSHRLTLRTLIAHIAEYGHTGSKNEHFLYHDLVIAFSMGLGVEKHRLKRERLRRIAVYMHRLTAGGMSDVEVKEYAAAHFGVSVRTLFNYEKLPGYASLRKGRKEYRNRYLSGAEEWFDAGIVDQVTQHLIEEMKNASGGKLSSRLRWDLFCILEGYHALGRPVSQPMLVAIDLALDLVHRSGAPREDVAMGGVKKRRQFMLLAWLQAHSPSTLTLNAAQDLLNQELGEDESVVEPPTVADWLESPLLDVAVLLFRKHLATAES
jgi:hypothetical protein